MSLRLRLFTEFVDPCQQADLPLLAGILTVAVVTYPFGFEGRRRGNQAQEGTETLRQVGAPCSLNKLSGVPRVLNWWGAQGPAWLCLCSTETLRQVGAPCSAWSCVQHGAQEGTETLRQVGAPCIIMSV